MSLSPEVGAWLQSLELSIDIRNPKRDLANGCVVAEILARYYPQDVSLHSFENVSSLPLKDANWHLLLKLFKRMGLAIGESMTNRVMLCEDGAAVQLMQQIWRHLVAPEASTPGDTASSDTAGQPKIQLAAANDAAKPWQHGVMAAGVSMSADAQQPWVASAPPQMPQLPDQQQIGNAGSDASGYWQQDANQATAGAHSHDSSIAWQTQQQVDPQLEVLQQPSDWQQVGNAEAATYQRCDAGNSIPAHWQYQMPSQWQQPVLLAEQQQWQTVQQGQWPAQDGQLFAAQVEAHNRRWQQLQQWQQQAAQSAPAQQKQPAQSRKTSMTSQPSRRATSAKVTARQSETAAAQPDAWQAAQQRPVPQYNQQAQTLLPLQDDAQAVFWQQQAMQQYWLQQQQNLLQHQQEQQLLAPMQASWSAMPQPEGHAQQQAPQMIAAFQAQDPAQYFQQGYVPGGMVAGAFDPVAADAPAADWQLAYADGQQQQQQQGMQSPVQHQADQSADPACEPEYSRMPTLAFDRKPRPVDFRPFTQEDFRQKNFDAKHAAKYWELGVLRPVPDEALETKQQNRERMREFGRRTAKVNHERLAALAAAQTGKNAPERPATARERAMSFAKCIPRPASGARLTQSAQGRLTAAVGGSNGSSCEGSGGSRLGTAQQRREDELTRLQRQHEVDQRDVAAIAQDLRMHTAAQAAGH